MQQRKRWSILLISILMMAFITSFFKIDTMAAWCNPNCTTEHTVKTSTCPLCGHEHGHWLLLPMNRIAYEMACIANGNILDVSAPSESETQTNANSNPTDVISVLELDTSPGGTFYMIFDIAASLYDNLAYLGAIIIFIYFLLEIAEVQMNDGFTYETLARHGIKTLAAFMIIINGYEIMMMALNTCSDIFQQVSSSMVFSAERPYTCKECPYWTYQIPIIWTALAGIFKHIIPYLIIMYCNIQLSISCWARVLDIMIRVIMAPIGMADIAHGGMNSNGIRYLKKLLASGLQGACMVGVIYCYSEIHKAISGGLSGYMLTCVVSLAMVTVIKKTGSIASEAIGM